jgi:hypothetical protein
MELFGQLENELEIVGVLTSSPISLVMVGLLKCMAS